MRGSASGKSSRSIDDSSSNVSPFESAAPQRASFSSSIILSAACFAARRFSISSDVRRSKVDFSSAPRVDWTE